MENTITLTLTPQDTQSILTALSKFPYSEVASLITNIGEQAKSQLEAKQEEPASESENK